MKYDKGNDAAHARAEGLRHKARKEKRHALKLAAFRELREFMQKQKPGWGFAQGAIPMGVFKRVFKPATQGAYEVGKPGSFTRKQGGIAGYIKRITGRFKGLFNKGGNYEKRGVR